MILSSPRPLEILSGEAKAVVRTPFTSGSRLAFPGTTSFHPWAGPSPVEQPSKMELGTILNTKGSALALAGRPMQFEMQHSMQHDLQQHQQYANVPPYGRIKSETGSERSGSPATDYSSRYSSTSTQPLQAYHPMPSSLGNDIRYPSPSHLQMPTSLMNGYTPTSAPDSVYQQNGLPPQQEQPGQQTPQSTGQAGTPQQSTGPPKVFACSTCGKGFARRSDLARHGEDT